MKKDFVEKLIGLRMMFTHLTYNTFIAKSTLTSRDA